MRKWNTLIFQGINILFHPYLKVYLMNWYWPNLSNQTNLSRTRQTSKNYFKQVLLYINLLQNHFGLWGDIGTVHCISNLKKKSSISNRNPKITNNKKTRRAIWRRQFETGKNKLNHLKKNRTTWIIRVLCFVPTYQTKFLGSCWFKRELSCASVQIYFGSADTNRGCGQSCMQLLLDHCHSRTTAVSPTQPNITEHINLCTCHLQKNNNSLSEKDPIS